MKMKQSKPQGHIANHSSEETQTHGKPSFRGIQGSKYLHSEIRKSIIKWFNNATQGVVKKKKPTISRAKINDKERRKQCEESTNLKSGSLRRQTILISP